MVKTSSIFFFNEMMLVSD